MLDLLGTINNSLGTALLPSTVPPVVLRFQNPQNSTHGSLDIRSSYDSSLVDFILKSWLHYKIPDGGDEINITTLFTFLDSFTDAPHLLLELIQGRPASLILLMDLLHRKDLILHPNYLDEFYQKTDLDGPRRDLEGIPEASPYRSSSLFIHSMLSPMNIAVSIECGKEGEAEAMMEEIVVVWITAAAKKIVRVWLEKCAGDEGRLVMDEEIGGLQIRDGMIKRKAVEIDLAANLPRMFGPEVAERVMAQIQKVSRV